MSQSSKKSKSKNNSRRVPRRSNNVKLTSYLFRVIKNSPKYGFIVGAVVLLITAGGITVYKTIYPAGQNGYKPPVDDTRIGTDDEVLKQYIKAYGADKTIAQIKTLPVDCHQRVHKVGRFNYELQGSKAFTTINSECMSGYTHGVTEAFFQEHGTENLAANLELICQGQQSGFYAHQCFHGVGHGLMAYNDYDLPAALQACDTLPPTGSTIESCYTGVFMENVVGAIGVDEAKAAQNAQDFHTSSWLSSDPLFPCNAVEVKYKNACYVFQTSRMIQIPDFDYRKVASSCGSIEPEYQSVCFLSMGRDVSNSLGSNYAEIEATCSYSENPEYQMSCIGGASQDKFWHESEQDDALGMCKAMQSRGAKQTCYGTISLRGSEIIATHEGSQAFCAKFEPEYQQSCSIKP